MEIWTWVKSKIAESGKILSPSMNAALMLSIAKGASRAIDCHLTSLV
jgi:hypothetical protein